MEVSAPVKTPVKRRIWMRIVAAVLVVGMLATAGLIESSKIIFSAAKKIMQPNSRRRIILAIIPGI